jgi:hypothetical protein
MQNRVLLDLSDIPTTKELHQGIERLRKDYNNLKDFGSTKHCDANSLLICAKFLEHILERETKRLQKK